jgi:hypothetical protein
MSRTWTMRKIAVGGTNSKEPNHAPLARSARRPETYRVVTVKYGDQPTTSGRTPNCLALQPMSGCAKPIQVRDTTV